MKIGVAVVIEMGCVAERIRHPVQQPELAHSGGGAVEPYLVLARCRAKPVTVNWLSFQC